MRVAWNKGKKLSQSHILALKKARASYKSKEYKGKVSRMCENCDVVFRVFPYLAETARFCSWKCRAISIGISLRGENHPNWIVNRDELKTDSYHKNDYKYRVWSRSVKKRDGNKCRIENSDCEGRLESHHILGWVEHPELRYKINNGITLCQAHHPRKKSEEKSMAPLFLGLLAEVKELS